MKKLHIIATLILTLVATHIQAQSGVEYRTEVAAHASSGTFAPYYFSANRYGVVTGATGAYLRAGAFIEMDTTRRFSYAAGIDLIGSYETASPVQKFGEGGFTTQYKHPSMFRIQQLYGEIKYRTVFLSVGIKERDNDNPITDQRFSSGNVVLSGNSRPIPQIEVGFFKFVDIPLTNGWVQIKGNIAYGKFIDDNYLRDHYNYYTSFLTTNVFYHYKSLYLRTNPNKPFVFTLGIEDAAQFGGDRITYRNGVLQNEQKSKIDFLSFARIFIPGVGDNTASVGDQAYVYGNHLGAIDLALEYNLRDHSQLRLYTQWIYEDGSGMGKLNGWDGLWGIAYHTRRKSIVSDAVIEYLDFSNQSGPIHWATGDHPGTAVDCESTGADDYYNNYNYNGWQHYGHGIGTPMSPSIMYNTNGYLRYLYTRLRGGHIAIGGYFSDEWQYRIMSSYRTSWGTPFYPAAKNVHQGSLLIECSYNPISLQGWSFSGAVAVDAGSMIGDNTGISISVRKSGTLFKFKKKSNQK